VVEGLTVIRGSASIRRVTVAEHSIGSLAVVSVSEGEVVAVDGEACIVATRLG
jgi:hypothetical protein